ncbi:hypothetical protein MRX96_038809 [Rhipicephalus microplus]
MNSFKFFFRVLRALFELRLQATLRVNRRDLGAEGGSELLPRVEPAHEPPPQLRATLEGSRYHVCQSLIGGDPRHAEAEVFQTFKKLLR